MPTLVIAGALPIQALSGAAGPAAEPARRPGLWGMEMSFDDGAYTVSRVTTCLDAAADARMTLVGAQMRRSACSVYQVSPDGPAAWRVRSVCALGAAGELRTTGRVSGDLSSAYTAVAEGVSTGAPSPAQNGRHTATVHARWLGACPAGQRGGDVTTGGRTVNALP